jgi:PAS domain S-box-containing protein
MIVEDDPGVARLQQLRLERAGYDVVVAATAAEALEKVRSTNVDLLLLDHNLPGGTSGLDLYQHIKAAGHDVPAILVTGLRGDSIVLQSFRAGVYDFVPKTPEYLDYLLPTIERVLKKRRTEFQLAESQARLECIISAAMDAILTVDEQHRIALLNPAAEQLFGCQASDVLGQAVERFLPDWAPSPMPKGQRLQPVETEAIRADGERLPVELAVSWVETGRRRFWTCMARDIRERRRAQEERERLIREQAARKAAEAGRERMAGIAQENARLYQELRHADQLKDEFLAMLAHELRNPLAPIRNALHLVRLAGPRLEPSVAGNFGIIERQVDHLVRLVDDLLDVSRISQGKIHLQKQPVDLAEVVARAVESSTPLIDARRHHLTVRVAAGTLIEGDAVRLVQIVSNLLNNAAKYTPEGGVIELVVESPVVARSGGHTAAAENEPGKVRIRVRDNGMGIPSEMLPRLFDLFTQSERTLDRADGGLGIGLTLVRRLTEMHKGRVQAFSPGPGQGSEFVVELPLLTSAPAALASLSESTVPGGKRRVLVVDDNRDAAATLARLLELLGNEVRIAHDGTQTLALAAEFLPDLVLLDIGLPGMDGYEVAELLRVDHRFDKTALVALTGYGSAEDRRQSQAAGFNAHLVKPVDLEALKHLLSHTKEWRLP